MLIYSQVTPARRVRSTNTTDASFRAIAPTQTRPAGTGGAAAQSTLAAYETAPDSGGIAPTAIELFPFAVGSNNNAFTIRVSAYKYATEGSIATAFWLPYTLCELLCTISSNAGCTLGAAMLGGAATTYFADTISVVGTSGNAGVSIDILSPADDLTIASVVVSLKAPTIFEVGFKIGTATSANAFYSLMC